MFNPDFMARSNTPFHHTGPTVTTNISSSLKLNPKERQYLTELVVNDALYRLQQNNNTSDNVTVNITQIDLSRSIVHYQLNDGTNSTQEYDLFKEMRDETGDLLARFTQNDRAEYKSKLKEATSSFFTTIAKPFKALAYFWSEITGKIQKKMAWNFSLLQEVCATYNTNQTITRTEALHYFGKLLKLENKSDSVELQRVLESAYRYSKEIDEARNSTFSGSMKRTAGKLVAAIKRDLQTQDRTLIPVGYMYESKLDNKPIIEYEDMLLEVKKTDSGKYQISLITTSTAQRELFDQSDDTEGIHRISPNRVISGLELSDIESRIGAWVEMEINPEFSAETSRELFLETFVFENSKLIESTTTKRMLQENVMGKANDVMEYIKTLRGDDAEHFDMSVRLHLFRSIANASNKWLKDPVYRQLIITTGHKILDEIHAHGDKLFKNLNDRSTQMTDIINEVQAVLDKIGSHERVQDINHGRATIPRSFDRYYVSTWADQRPLEEGALNPFKPYATDIALELPKENNVLAAAATLVKQCERLEADKQWDAMQRVINLFAATFPEIDSESIKNLPVKERETLSNQLNRMGYFWMQSRIHTETNMTASYFFTTITLLAWTHKLLYYETGSHQTGINWIYKPVQNLLALGPFELSPSERVRFEKIEKYVSEWKLESPADFHTALENRYKKGLTPAAKNAITQLEWVSAGIGRIPPNYSLDSTKEYPGEIQYDPVEKILYYYTPKYRVILSGSLAIEPTYPRNRMFYHTEILDRVFTAERNHSEITKGERNISPVSAMVHANLLGSSLIANASFTPSEIGELLSTQEIVHPSGDAITVELKKANVNVRARNTFEVFFRNPQFFNRYQTRELFNERLLTNGEFKAMLTPEYAESNKLFLNGVFDNLTTLILRADRDKNTHAARFLIRMRERMIEEIELAECATDIKKFILGENPDSSIQLLGRMIAEYKIKDPNVDNAKLGMLHTELLSEYSCKIKHSRDISKFSTSDDLINITYSLTQMHQLNDSKNDTSDHVENIAMLRQLIIPILIKATQGSDGSKLVNAISKKLNLNAKDTTWKVHKAGGFPIFEAENPKGLLLNLLTGEFFYDKIKAQLLPRLVVDSLYAQLLFKDALFDQWKVHSGYNEIAYTHPDYPEFRIFSYPGHNAFTIQRQSPLNKDTYLPLLTDTYLPLFTNDSMRLDGYNHIFNENNIVFGGRKDTSSEFFVYSKSSGKLQYRFSTSKGLFNSEGQSALLPSTMPKAFMVLHPLINCWGRKGKIERVDYPNIKSTLNDRSLTYKLEGKDFVCNLHPGYRLITPKEYAGVVGLPAAFQDYQLLEKNGKYKILVTGAPINKVQASVTTPRTSVEAATSEAYVERTASINDMEKVVYSYDLDLDSGKLKADSGEGYLYLSYLMGEHKRFSEALFYLAKADLSNMDFSRANQVLDLGTDKDRSFAGTAFALKRELLKSKFIDAEQMRADAKGTTSAFHENSHDLFQRYSAVIRLYERYHQLEKSFNQSEKRQIDSALVLSEDELGRVKIMMQDLVRKRNMEKVSSAPVATSTAAIATPAPTAPSIAKGEEIWGVQDRVLQLWANAGNRSVPGTFIFGNREWIRDSFYTIFQSIYDMEPTDPKFKEIALSVRLEAPKGTYDRNSFEGILMRIIAAKETGETLNLGLSGGKLPQMKRGFVLSKEEREYVFTKCFRTTNVPFPYSIQATNMLIQQLEARMNLRESESNYLESWTGSKGVAALKNYRSYLIKHPQVEASEKKTHFIDYFFGKSARVSMQAWEQVLNKVDQLPGELNISGWQTRVPISKKEAVQQAEMWGVADTASRLLQEMHAENMGTNAQEAMLTSLEKTVASTITSSLEPVKAEKPQPVITGISIKETLITETCPTNYFDQFKAVTEPALRRIADEHYRDFNAYSESTKAQKSLDISKQEIREIEKTLSKSAEELTALAAELGNDIEEKIEKLAMPAGIVAMDRIAGQKAKPKLDYLTSLWRMNQLTLPWNENPLRELGIQEMSPEVLQELDRNITRYLEVKSNLSHVNRTISALHDVDRSFTPSNPNGDPQLKAALHSLLTTTRHFIITPISNREADLAPSQRDLLFLEAQLDLVLRRNQIETLSEMLSNPNAARQLPMGGGKSKVLLPLLAKRKATGKNLVALIVPDFLYETNRSNLQATNRELFNQEMFCFEFSRHSTIDQFSIRNLRLRLLETMCTKGFILTTKSFMLNFMNSFKEKQAQLALIARLENNPASLDKEACSQLEKMTGISPINDSGNLTQDLENYRTRLIGELKEMSRILNIFKKSGDIVGDEIDGLLDVRKMVNFAIGSRKQIARPKTDAASFIVGMIINANPSSLLHELAKDIATNLQGSITPQKREQYLASIAEAYFDERRDLLGLDANQKQLFVKYLTNDQAITEIPPFVERLRNTNEALYQEVVSAKQFINSGLRITLQRVGNVDYGRDPVSERLVIPYKASNTPSIGSEFNDEMERIAFTLQDYIQAGVTQKDLFDRVASYRAAAIHEFRQSDPDEILTIDQTESGIAFAKFIEALDPENKISRSLLLRDDHIEVKKLVDFINASAYAKFSYCALQVLPRIEQTTDQVTGNAEDLVDMAHHFGGFTGTPWNRHTFADKIDATKAEGVDGRTYFALLKKPISVVTIDLDQGGPVSALLNQTDLVSNYQALIDAGAYLRGVSNKQFADQVQKIAEEKKVPLTSVVYFNDAGVIISENVQTKEASPIENIQQKDLQHQFTLYDQSHTVGADILQSPTAKAIVTIGEDTFTKDLFQAVWRLRQLDKNQSVTFAITTKIKQRIMGDEYGKREPNIEDILKFCMLNESKREAEDNFRAEKEKIEGAPSRAMVDQMIKLCHDPKATEEDFLAMSSAFTTTIVQSRDEEKSYGRFAEVQTMQEPAKVLAKSKIAARDKLCAAAKMLPENQKTYSESLEAAGKTVSERKDRAANLQPTLVEVMGGENGKEAQAQAQSEQEMQLQMELSVEKQTVQQVQNIVAPSKVHTNVADHSYKPLTPQEFDALLDGNQSESTPFLSFGVLPIFDSTLVTTTSFEPQMKESVKTHTIFNVNRQPVVEVMFCKNKQGKMHAIIPSKQQVRDGCQQYVRTSGKEAVIVTVGTSAPLILSSSNANSTEIPFQGEDLKAYHRLLVQAKFFAGIMSYPTNEERDALKEWIKEVGAKNAIDLFENQILINLPVEKQRVFIESSLYRIFQALR